MARASDGIPNRPTSPIPWLAIVLTALIVVLILAGTSVFLLRSRYTFDERSQDRFEAALVAETVRLHISGLSAAAEDRVAVSCVDPNYRLRAMLRQGDVTSYWHIHNQLIRKVLIKLPARELPNLESLTVTIGDETLPSFNGKDVGGWRRQNPESLPDAMRGQLAPDDVILIVPIPDRSTSLFFVRWIVPVRGSEAFLNWPGDGRFLQLVGQYALLPIVLVLMLSFFCIKNRTPLSFSPSPPLPFSHSFFWNWVGLLFLAGALTFLEVRDPYYFCQCDTLSECFPMILFGCRSIWEGVFPNYNPYLFLGSPLANLGIYGLTYPPLLASYALARHVLDNEYATIEIFAIGHLLAGFLLTRLLARRIGMSALPANVAALAFVLSGASLIMGRSWFNFIPLVVWLPVLLLGLLRLRQGPASWRWIAGMGLAMGLPTHVGFSQVAIYINGFFCLALAYWMFTGILTWQRAKCVLPALMIGAAISLPLVYQQWLIFDRAMPRQSQDDGIAMGLPAMLLPYPLVKTQVPPQWGNSHLEFMGQFYYFGSLLAFLFFYQVVRLFFAGKETRRQGDKEKADDTPVSLSPCLPVSLSGLWTFCALIALWLSMGAAGGLWKVVSWLPVVGSINRHPLRVMPFIVFFAAMSGGLVLERIIQRARKAGIGVAIFVLLDLAMHVALCRTAFHVDDYLPYPNLPEKLNAMLWKQPSPASDGFAPGRLSPHAVRSTRLTGRVFSWGRQSLNDTYPLIVPKNLPAVYELPTFDGTNPLLAHWPIMTRAWDAILSDRMPALKAYGVRWYFEQMPEKLTPAGTATSGTWMVDVLTGRERLTHRNGRDWQAWRDNPHPFKAVFEGQGIIVSELAPVDPLAFPAGDPNTSLPIALSGQGLDVRVAGQQEEVVINFLKIPDMKAYLDGEPLPSPFRPDPWGRIRVELPRKGELLSIRYAPPWATGLWMGLGLLVAAIGCAWYLSKEPRTK